MSSTRAEEIARNVVEKYDSRKSDAVLSDEEILALQKFMEDTESIWQKFLDDFLKNSRH